MSKFNLKILSKYQEDKAVCYLCEADLFDYLENLDDKYNEYDIQRGIVSNHFLEKLADTLKNSKFIPSIILVSDEDNEIIINANIDNILLSKGKFKILDGLQRTVRLKKLLEATKFINEYSKEIKTLSNIRLRKFFRENNSGFKTYADYIIEAKNNNLKIDFFKRKQWFEIWTNLNRDKQIEKMIIFNAGHKSMDIKHQLELIFLNSVDLDEEKCSYEKSYENKCKKEKLCIIHSKDISTRSFYNKKRKYDIHFTLLIDAIIALEHKKPFKVDQKSIVNFQEEYGEYKIIQKIVSDYLHDLLDFFKFLDEIFCKEYQEKGLEFLGREAVIIGIFSAIGKYIDKNKYMSFDNFSESLEEIKSKVSKNLKYFNLGEFEKMKKNVDITAFNIGDIMKETVYYVTLQILNDKQIKFSNFPVNNSYEYRSFIEGLKND
jgi:predicted transcriptional regulator